MGKFDDKRVLVTGAAGGIGQGIIHAYLREGARVFAADLRASALDDVLSQLPAGFEGRVCTGVLDVTNLASIAECVASVRQQFGGVDILVNGAGLYPSHPVLEMTEENWDRVLDTNLKGPFLLSQTVAKSWVDNGETGNIVNITSGASERARPGAAHYCTSKAGLNMLTRALALEFARYGIRVNAVSPGFVQVDSEVNPLSVDYVQAISRTIPLGRVGHPSDIAKAVLFVSSEEAEWMTGSVVRMDGGSGAGNGSLPLSRV